MGGWAPRRGRPGAPGPLRARVVARLTPARAGARAARVHACACFDEASESQQQSRRRAAGRNAAHEI